MIEVSLTNLILFIFYPLLLISISIFVSIEKDMTSKRYFFADKNVHWLVLGLSFGFTSLLSPYLLGLTYSGQSGILTVFYLIVLCVVVYLYRRFLFHHFLVLKINSIPEYFEKRYNTACRYIVSILYVIKNIGIRLFLVLAAGNILIDTFTEFDSYFTLLFFIVITVVHLIIGGQKAEIITSFIQLSLIGLIIICFSFWVFQNQSEIITLNYGKLFFDYDSVFSAFQILLALSIIGFWFIGVDEFSYHRFLTIKNQSHIKKTLLALIIYQLIPFFIFSIAAVIIFNNNIEKISQGILRKFFYEKGIPAYLQSGIVLSIVLGMTSLFSNCFSCTANLIVNDFYKVLKPYASDRELVLAGRIILIFLLCISILLIPASLSYNYNLYTKLFYLFLYLTSIITALVVSSLLFNSLSGSSALIMLVISTALVILKFFVEFYYSENLLAQIDVFQFTILVFIFTIIMQYLLSRINFSFLKKKITEKKLISTKSNCSGKVLLALPIYLTFLKIIEHVIT